VVFRGDSKWAINNPGRLLGMLQKELGSARGSWWWLIGGSEDLIFDLLISHVSKDLTERRDLECGASDAQTLASFIGIST